MLTKLEGDIMVHLASIQQSAAHLSILIEKTATQRTPDDMLQIGRLIGQIDSEIEKVAVNAFSLPYEL